MAAGITLFDYFHYAEKIKALVEDAFPALNTVSFPPTLGGDYTETRYSDVALPAFLMNFEDPTLDGKSFGRKGVDILDPRNEFDLAGDYYMPLTINVVGYLLIPVFPEYNADVPNTNTTLLVCAASANVAAAIHAGAGGFGAGDAKINNIHYVDDSIEDVERNFHVGEIHWSHEAIVGNVPSDELAVDIDQIWAWLTPDWDGDFKPAEDRTYDLRAFVFPTAVPDVEGVLNEAIDTVAFPEVSLPEDDDLTNVGSVEYFIEPFIPRGLSFDSTELELTGTPTEAVDGREFRFTAIYTEGNRELTISEKFTITIS